MPLPTQIGVDEAATFCGTSVGVRKEEDVDTDDVEGSEERPSEVRVMVGEVSVRTGWEAGGTVVVVSKDEERPPGYVVYTVVTSVPPDIERDKLEMESWLLTDRSLSDATEA